MATEERAERTPSTPASTPASMPTTAEPTLEEIAVRLDESGAQIEVQPEEPREVLRRHVEALNDLHAGALRAIVRRLRADDRGRELLFELVDEPIVRMALSVHGLIRAAPPEESGGGATQGQGQAAGEGEPSSISPILEITQVGADEDFDAGAAELDLTSGVPVKTEPSVDEDGWIKTFPVMRIGPGRVVAVALQTADGEAVEAIIVNAGERLSAFVNACPHRGMPLDGALISDMDGTLTCPWHGLCFDVSSGECLSSPGSSLTSLPLSVQGGYVWIRATN